MKGIPWSQFSGTFLQLQHCSWSWVSPSEPAWALAQIWLGLWLGNTLSDWQKGWGGERAFGGQTGKRRVETVFTWVNSIKKPPNLKKPIPLEFLFYCQAWTTYLSEWFREQGFHRVLWNMFTFFAAVLWERKTSPVWVSGAAVKTWCGGAGTADLQCTSSCQSHCSSWDSSPLLSNAEVKCISLRTHWGLGAELCCAAEKIWAISICFVKARSFPDISKKGFSLANLWILCYLQVTLKWTRWGWCGFSTNPQSRLFPEYFLLIKALKLKSWILFPALPLSPLSSACCPQATAECSFLAATQGT